jgi:hypothetical protein
MRENDSIIMDHINQIGFTKAQRRTFNNWRLYMQVTNIAEIATLNGEKIKDEYFHAKYIDELITNSKIRWPKQQRPAMDTFLIWKRGIKRITQCDSAGILKDKLGKWHQEPASLMRYTQVMAKSGDNLLLKNKNGKWDLYNNKLRLRGNYYFENISTTCVEMYDHNEYIAVTTVDSTLGKKVHVRDNGERNKSTVSESKDQEIEESFSEFVKNTAIMEMPELLKHFSMGDENQLWVVDDIMIATDGGARDHNKGTYGIVVATKEKIIAS